MAITSLREAEQTIRQRERRGIFALLGPAMVYLLLFFALPLVVIVLYSFLRPGQVGGVEWSFTLDNYVTLFTKDLYVDAYVRSLAIGGATTVLCLLLGYPMALAI